jgi:uncharacterized protein YacL
MRMSIYNLGRSSPERHPALTTLLFATLGFICGLLLSMLISAYTLYACIAVI